MKKKEEVQQVSRISEFVFMEKTISILDVGLKTGKNVILYGPGGHGKSELTLEYLYEKGIVPYVITMGSGMTTDRLFGGINIPVLETEGKLEYLVENSFMNHQFVIFEELMDAPDFILEQLKDILSAREFRNGSQVYPIKTQFIVCCTNKTRTEFAKNDSLKALMERFPLELNVIWDNYNEISYNKLLEARFGTGNVDPIIPFILQEYHKQGVTISPRIAIDAYEIYAECGPDSLIYIAEFAKKPQLISDTLKKYQSSLTFKKYAQSIEEAGQDLVTQTDPVKFVESYNIIKDQLKEIKKLTVTDDLAQIHANLVKKANEKLNDFENAYIAHAESIETGQIPAPKKRASKKVTNGVEI